MASGRKPARPNSIPAPISKVEQAVANKQKDQNVDTDFTNDFKWIGITTGIVIVLLIVAYIVAR
jgi:hypothetical protein